VPCTFSTVSIIFLARNQRIHPPTTLLLAGPAHPDDNNIDREYLFHVSDHFLHRQPVLEWEASLGPCTLLLLDPDAPAPRGGDGSKPGSLGPWLHWLVTDAVGQPENGR
jgi:hypothetical protein